MYQDGPFRVVRTSDGARLSPDPADAPFLMFVSAVAEHFDRFEVFGRIEGSTGPEGRQLLPAGTGLVPLPAYGSLLNLPGVVRAAVGTARAFRRSMDRVDVVWAFGPHPFQMLLVAVAVLHRKRVVIGVRQDTPADFRARLPSRRWRPVLALVDALDAFSRLVSRRVPATVVGEDIARRYERSGGQIAVMAPTLVRSADVVANPPRREWDDDVVLLTVGRVDREKNPMLLVRCIAELERAHPGRYRLRWVGTGPLADDVAREAGEQGVADRIDLVGYVPFGPRLLALYREAHAFVHVSLTEGTPQVLIEALASGPPVVATDVGGVRRAVGNGDAALLVPPADLDALTAAIRRLAGDA